MIGWAVWTCYCCDQRSSVGIAESERQHGMQLICRVLGFCQHSASAACSFSAGCQDAPPAVPGYGPQLADMV